MSFIYFGTPRSVLRQRTAIADVDMRRDMVRTAPCAIARTGKRRCVERGRFNERFRRTLRAPQHVLVSEPLRLPLTRNFGRFSVRGRILRRRQKMEMLNRVYGMAGVDSTPLRRTQRWIG